MSGRRTLGAFAGYPPTWAAALIALASAGTVALAGDTPSLASVGVGMSTAAVSLALWTLMGLRSKGFAHHLYKARKRAAAARSTSAREIADALAACGEAQAAAQAKLLEKKMAAVRDVLLQRLDAGELTFDRYLGTAEQVYLAGVDNLRELKVAVTARNGIDLDYLAQRSEALGTRADKEADTERAALAERGRRHRELEASVRGRLAQNEAIMTALDSTAATMAQAKIGTPAASVGAEEAMEALAGLAARTARYEEASR